MEDVKKEEEKKVEKPASSKANKQEKKEQKTDETVMYLGSSMVEHDKSGTVAFHIGYGSLYSNGLPDDVKARVEKDKDFAKLFVPVSGAAAALRKLQDQDSDLFAAKKKVTDDYLSRRAKKEG